MPLPALLSAVMQRLHRPIYLARQEALVAIVLEHLEPGDRVLDVGCGFGSLGRAILDHPRCPLDVEVRGLERVRRETQLVPIDEYDTERMPYDDGAFDLVMLADVLHHEDRPHVLIGECRRVAGRRVIIKDNKIDGPLAWPRICLIDWAANAPYQVRCLFRYNTLAEWRTWLGRHRLEPVDERVSMRIYPPFVNWLFGRRLQYLVVAAPDTAPET